jgi:MFS family permease
MLATYRAVFRAPGSAAFCAAGFVMRMPMAIYSLGIVLIVSANTGRYGFAGVLSACFILGSAPGNPYLARLVDRHGQRRVLVPATFAHAAAVLTLAIMLQTGAADWTLIVPTVLAGFTYLPVESLVRARWSAVLAGRPELTTAYSLESILDELIFVVGPLVATLIATHASPILVLYVAVTLVTAGGLWLAAQRATEPAPRPSGPHRHPSALRSRGMVLLTIVAVAMGAIFASAEVATVAFCGQHGHRGAAGLVLACMAVGSGLAGFLYGSRTWSADMLTRFRIHVVTFGVIPFIYLAAVNIVALAVCAFVVGLAVAPTLITSFGLIGEIVDPAALTEGLAWLTMGLNLGYAVGAALVGGIADAHGARVAFGVTMAAGLAMAAAGLVLHRRLRSAPAVASPVAVG